MELFSAFLVVNSRDQHAAGVDAHHGSGRQIHDGDAGFSDQFFRLVVFVNAGKNDSIGASSVIQDKFQEFFGLFDRFAGLDLDGAEIGFRERLEVHKVLEQRLNFDLGEVTSSFAGAAGAASALAASFLGRSSGFIVGIKTELSYTIKMFCILCNIALFRKLSNHICSV